MGLLFNFCFNYWHRSTGNVNNLKVILNTVRLKFYYEPNVLISIDVSEVENITILKLYY